ncbi:trypsin-like peptidase domain-containing protein [Streptomyces sp. NPDC048392]|uniref:S1C family serine protease n=1 Tax=Streptomyces sp. NPDC048392 TaxID=3365543 RepID=UPI003721E5FB
MNEGKPTKTKWWSRPRSSDDPRGGDFELEGPRPVHTAGAGTLGRETDGDDFELARPSAARVSGEGDYELDLPHTDAATPTDAAPPPQADTDVHPAEEAGGQRQGDAQSEEAGGQRQGDAQSVDAGGQRQEDAQSVDAGSHRQAGPGAAPSVDAGAQPRLGIGSSPAAHGTPTAEATAERPKPLHEPDPYSTPPYGEPGPWAPAPPVQHPAATPAHGTVTAPPHAPVPQAPAAHAPVPPVSAAQVPVPSAPASCVPAAEVPAPHAPVHASAPHAPVPQAPAAHAPVPPASASSVAPPPGAASDPSLADAPAPVPQTGQARHPAAPPAYDTGVHASAAPASAPGSASASSPGVPASGPSQAGASDPWAEPADPAPGAEPAPDPWGRYDPWAASAAASLQRHDAAVRTPRQRRGRATKTLVGGALLIALVSGGIGGAMGTYLERNGGVGTVELPQAGPEAVERAPDSVAGIAARALPSVVTLHVSGSEAAGTGTGFVLDGRGHILTNHHVVEPAGSGGEITVTFNSGDTAEATVVGGDSGYDLAVVKVKGVSGLTPMPLGNSDSVRVGDPVVAIGAPFDLAGTVTSGIISAKERPITAGGGEGDGSDVSYVDALQTDAPINPGNSGGPLLDARGRAIGINSAIRSADSGGAETDGGQAGSIGLGFAIPINQGKRVAEELINTGRATHPVIGITLDMNYAGDGARVGAKGSGGGPAVTGGGPGAEAGIEPGDVITAVDGQRVHSGEELIVKTRAHRPGDRLELTLERDGEETKVSLVLGSAGGD